MATRTTMRLRRELRRHRVETLQINQRVAARKAGLSQASVSRIESGAGVTNLDVIDRYARALGCRLVVELEAR